MQPYSYNIMLTLKNTCQHYDNGLWLHIIREYWHKPHFWSGLASNPAPTSDLAWPKEVNNNNNLIIHVFIQIL